MDDCNLATTWAGLKKGIVQIPLWTIVTAVAFDRQVACLQRSDSSMDDCNFSCNSPMRKGFRDQIPLWAIETVCPEVRICGEFRFRFLYGRL